MNGSLDQFPGSRTPRSRGTRTRRHLAAAALAATATLAMPATAMASTFKLTPHIANHTPIVKRLWPITIDVTKGTTKLSGSVKYEFLFGNMVVGHQPGHKFTKGVYKDTLTFTSPSIGQHLTLRILVKTKYGTEHLDWKVTPKK